MKRILALVVAGVIAAAVAVPSASAAGNTVNDFLIGSSFVLGGVARQLPGQPLKIRTGDTVTWTNLDPISHDVTFEDGSFSKYLNRQGEQTRRTFSKAGYYLYRCNQHPGMNGLVYVSDSAPF